VPVEMVQFLLLCTTIFIEC